MGAFKELWLETQDKALADRTEVENAPDEIRDSLRLTYIFSGLFDVAGEVNGENRGLLGAEYTHVLMGGKPHDTVQELKEESRRRLGE